MKSFVNEIQARLITPLPFTNFFWNVDHPATSAEQLYFNTLLT